MNSSDARSFPIVDGTDQPTGKVWHVRNTHCERWQDTTSCDFLLASNLEIPGTGGLMRLPEHAAESDPLILPDHVCPGILRESTQQLAFDVWQPKIEDTDQWKQWQQMLTRWPLPAGRVTIATYAKTLGLSPPQLPSPLPSPIVHTRPDVWIGLAVTHRLPEGIVRLLGTVTTDDNEWFTFAGAIIQTERVMPLRGRPDEDPLHIRERALHHWYANWLLTASRVRLRALGKPLNPENVALRHIWQASGNQQAVYEAARKQDRYRLTLQKIDQAAEVQKQRALHRAFVSESARQQELARIIKRHEVDVKAADRALRERVRRSCQHE